MEPGENSNLLASQDFIVTDNNYAIDPILVIYKTFSAISWILLMYSSWEAFVEKNSTYMLLNIINEGRIDYFDYYSNRRDYTAFIFPLNIKLSIFQAFITVLIIFGFFNYIIYTMIKANQNLDNAFFGRISKFHFIPLLLVSIIFLLMKNVNMITLEEKYYDYSFHYEYNKDQINMTRILVIVIFAFTILAFISLFIIYIKTDISCNYILHISIKKGVYSSLLVLLFHNIFNCIIAFKFINDLGDTKKIYEFFRLSRKIFCPLLGILTIIFAFIFNDVIALFSNLLMYIGMLTSVKMNIEGIEDKNDEGIDQEIITDAIIVLASFIGLFFFSCNRFEKRLLN